ncbi:MAG: hypothetical protein OSB34_11785 [Planktomarina sp.]|nr:hypothetical protein [Planktomarina sp.]
MAYISNSKLKIASRITASNIIGGAHLIDPMRDFKIPLNKPVTVIQK